MDKKYVGEFKDGERDGRGIPFPMVQNMKVNGRMVKEMEKGFIPILTAQNMRVSGRMVKEMEKGSIDPS